MTETSQTSDTNIQVDFVHTGPETLAGRYLRTFWQPIYLSSELKPGHAVPIRIMSEDFTLFRGESGAAYVVDFRCAHRGTQLSVGWVEEDCIRCFYHGWKYEGTGQCVEQPAESESFAEKIKIRSWTTQEYLGLIFAYFGDGAAPPLPRYPELQGDGEIDVSTYVRYCNFFGTLENGVDQAHVPFTHAKSNFTKFGLNWDIPKITAEETDYGVAMYGTRSNGKSRVNHYIMPNILYIKGSPEDAKEGWREAFAWRVPVDDFSHRSFNIALIHVTGEAAERFRERQRQQQEVISKLPSAHKMAAEALAGRINVHDIEERPDIVNIQDHVAQEGQGSIPNREAERLGRSDVAVILVRQIWRRELRALAEGKPTKEWRRPAPLVATSGGLTMRASTPILRYRVVVGLILLVCFISESATAQTTEQLIAAAKNEKELFFVAGPTTFGGKKGLSEIEAAFNKRFAFDSKIRFSAGPEMNAMAARVISEYKAGGKASTDIYLGSLGQFANLHREEALEEVSWSGIFPWIARPMEEIVSRRGVLVYSSPRGIVYNTNLIPANKAPKSYEDLVDPRLSQTWAGKIAVPPYPNWLVELSLIWGEEKLKDFTRKLVALNGGWLRYGEEERVISGEFPIMANIGDALATMWKWQAKAAPLVAVLGSTPGDASYFHLGVPKNSGHPNLAKLFIGFMISKEGQAIIEKHESRSSHLVETSRMAKYLRDNKVKLQEPKELFNFYLKGGGAKLNEELGKMLKQ